MFCKGIFIAHSEHFQSPEILVALWLEMVLYSFVSLGDRNAYTASCPSNSLAVDFFLQMLCFVDHMS